MSSSNKCTTCGSLDLDTEHGNVYCIGCGTVLEHSAIVSEVQFEENAHGGSTALGQFVSADSKGGASGFGPSFHTGLCKESREITQQKAKRDITDLAHRLRLNQLCIDEAFNFFKMALSRQLTRGRRSAHVIAACLYMTCRIEGTPHLLIDFSDKLQIDAYRLGRTYIQLSQELSLAIPSIDPCLFILRFAHQLDFGDKTHEVSMTALRLVQRMKRDSIHTGRRPSGLCGAALLIAARLHEFNRKIDDVIKIVKVHESTLRKRLLEFGETPSSALTLDEFMNVDLEEEQDPPSYKAARKKDKERDRVQRLMEEQDFDKQVSSLQQEIERQLEESRAKSRRLGPLANLSVTSGLNMDADTVDASRFADQSTIGVIEDCLNSGPSSSLGLGPNLATMGLLGDSRQPILNPTSQEETGEIDLEDIDDNEIDSYIMTEQEALNKDSLWMRVNADYLKELKEKEEKAKKALEEGKPEKKKRKPSTKRTKNNAGTSSSSAGEAVQKMLQEKKISSKINYDVLKNLNLNFKADFTPSTNATDSAESNLKRSHQESTSDSETLPPNKTIKRESSVPRVKREKGLGAVLPVVESAPPTAPDCSAPDEPEEAEEFEDLDGEEEVVEGEAGMSLSQMLNQHRGEDDCYGEDYDGYDDY